MSSKRCYHVCYVWLEIAALLAESLRFFSRSDLPCSNRVDKLFFLRLPFLESQAVISKNKMLYRAK